MGPFCQWDYGVKIEYTVPLMEQLDLDAVVAFTRVVQRGSFSAAANALGLPKSTVSRRVAALERRLGARLLQRTTRRLHLTDVGADYFARCEGAVRELEEADRAVAGMHGTPRGVLRLTAPIDLGATFLGKIVADFCALYPEVSVSSVVTNRFVDLVGEGFDLALRAGRITDSSFIGRKIMEDIGRLYASPGYLEARGRPSVPEDLVRHDCVVFGARSTTAWRLESPKRTVEISVTGRIVADDFSLIRAAAIAGAGIAWMPALIADLEVALGRLERVLAEYSTLGGQLYAVYPSARHVPAKVRAFIDFLAASLKERGR